MGIALPGESPEYRAARDRLLEKEVGLRREMEAVAAARRKLPPGGPAKLDYVFQAAGADGQATDVRLSELFAPGKDSLVIYSFMFPRDPAIRHLARPRARQRSCPSPKGRARRALRCSTSSMGRPSTPANRSTLPWSRRRRYRACWHAPASGDGADSGSCPRRVTAITATTSQKHPTVYSGRC